MSDIAIQVDQLSKQYRIGGQQSENRHSVDGLLIDALQESAASAWRRVHRLWRAQAHSDTAMYDTIWALKNISFEIKQGEVVGIIGRNGAGKSTLLKILARITEPTCGEAVIYGRVGSLLEVGTGFHAELTGRENVYLNGAILGMRRREIEHRFDEIVDFSGVERFIDTPVKHYSSGMRMRLAFAVAAHLEPEILLVDEVLSVGDAQFRKKCLGKMDDVAKGGRTVVFVSHNMATMMALCPRILYLQDGQLQMDGRSEESIARYMADSEESVDPPLAQRTDREGNGNLRITEIRWLDAKTREPLRVVSGGQAVYLEVSYAAAPDYQKPIDNLEVHIGICTQLGQFIAALNSRVANNAFQQCLPASGQLYCYLERFPLLPGRFYGNCVLTLNGMVADRVLHAFSIDVDAGDFFGTGFTFHSTQHHMYIPHQWFSALPAGTL
jgi:lipopolysaccharide transport system ATP-binding protein